LVVVEIPYLFGVRILIVCVLSFVFDETQAREPVGKQPGDKVPTLVSQRMFFDIEFGG
jgi:hypothetical protein